MKNDSRVIDKRRCCYWKSSKEKIEERENDLIGESGRLEAE